MPREILTGADAEVCHLVAMRFASASFRGALILAAALLSTACFQMTTVLKVNGDGGGTISHRMVYTKAALAQLKSFAAFGGGGRAAAGF